MSERPFQTATPSTSPSTSPSLTPPSTPSSTHPYPYGLTLSHVDASPATVPSDAHYDASVISDDDIIDFDLVEFSRLRRLSIERKKREASAELEKEIEAKCERTLPAKRGKTILAHFYTVCSPDCLIL